jgi:GDP-mannose 6-dehydrogenase
MGLAIGILGLGYVGTTTAACLARDGHRILGVDINPEKVAAIAQGRSPVVEPGVEALLKAAVRAGRLTALSDIGPALDQLDMVMVCVGTPSRLDGRLDLSHLLEVTRQLGRALRSRVAGRPLLLVYRSTVPPGTMERLVLPALERASGEAVGERYEVVFAPEFLREGSAIADYDRPPKIVLGERRQGVSQRLFGIWEHLDAPVFEVPFAVAEMVKFVDNCFHALKVAFANEIGRICVSRGIDPQAVADIFLADTKLNISPLYLRPGGPYGGSCLPKDLAAMLALAREAGLAVPVLAGTQESNALHLAWITARIHTLAPPPGPVLLAGLSFKAGTDDLRNSPWLELAERLLDAGYDLRVHDPDLDPDRLVGVNFALALEHGELLRARLAEDPKTAMAGVRLVVLGKPLAGLSGHLPPDVPVFDLTRLSAAPACA